MQYVRRLKKLTLYMIIINSRQKEITVKLKIHCNLSDLTLGS
jgi:hypothetical protein